MKRGQWRGKGDREIGEKEKGSGKKRRGWG